MHSYHSRVSTVFATLVAALLWCGVFNYATSRLFPPDVSGGIRPPAVMDLGVARGLDAERANLRLSLKADLTSAFNWNTKQLFVYVVAEYQTQKNNRNSVIVWDRIVTSKSKAVFEVNEAVNKYPLTDQYRMLRARTIRLRLKYRYMPWVGISSDHEVAVTEFDTPTEYVARG